MAENRLILQPRDRRDQDSDPYERFEVAPGLASLDLLSQDDAQRRIVDLLRTNPNTGAYQHPEYGWVVPTNSVKLTNTAIFGGGGMSDAIGDAAPYAGMLAGLAGGYGLLSGGFNIPGLDSLTNFLGGGDGLVGGAASDAAGAIGGGIAEGSIPGAITDLGSGWTGLAPSGGGTASVGPLGELSAGWGVGEGTVLPGAGGLEGELSAGWDYGQGPLNTGTGSMSPGTATTPPGTPNGSGMWDRILNGNGTADDWMKILGGAGSSLLGVAGSNAVGNDLKDIYNTQMGLGAPYRDLLAASYAPGFSIANTPDIQNASAQATSDMARALSARVGNPATNPSAQGELITSGINRNLGYLNNYRNQLGTFGQLGVSGATSIAPAMAGNTGSTYDAVGYGLGQLTNPQTSINDIMRAVNREREW